MLTLAAPAFAQGHGGGGGHAGGGGHFGGGGHSFGGGGHAFGGGHGFGHGGREFGDRGHGYGYRGYGYGGALLGGLALGYALDPYNYDDAYYDAYPGQCVAPQNVWDPTYGRYVVREVPYGC
jgi:hypothetical protein